MAPDTRFPERRDPDDWAALALESSPNAVVMINQKGRIVLLNRQTELLFGYERRDLIGRSIEELVPERVRAAHTRYRDEFLAAPSPRPMGAGRELFGRRKDGTEVAIEIGLTPVETSRGQYVLAAIIDITERRQAEEGFRTVVEAAPSAMVMVDPAGRITLVNRTTEKLFKYPRAELLGQSIEILVPERHRASHPTWVEQFFREPQVRPVGAGRELYGRRSDGVEFPIEIGLNPIRTAEGLSTLASVTDISERKRADAAQSRLAAIVQSSDDAIVSRDMNGSISSWNRGATELFGYSAEEVLGHSVQLLDPERGSPPPIDEEEGPLTRHFEASALRKDGSRLPVSVRWSPLRDSEAELQGYSMVARDISEQKQRDAELRRSNQELEHFAYVASHDLQEPLRMVVNYTELLAERYGDQLDERAHRYIQHASDGARRMQRLVSDLLSYSRVNSQGRGLTSVDAAVALREVVSSLRSQLSRAGASLDIGELPRVMGDEIQLRQLFQNLLTNSLKFRGAEPLRIAVQAAPRGEEWEFSVTDNGIGMEMKYAERIFQMFQRLHEPGKYEGSGIGLAIAKRIVERHGGTLSVESEPGAGATFYFTLRGVVLP